MPEPLLSPSDWILPFTSPLAADAETGVALVGGKGANLARMAQAGLPVPAGFLITTLAYRRFLAENRLDEPIRAALLSLDGGAPAALESVSANIRARFAGAPLPDELAAAILSAYRGMGGPAVAVRSSATAEDLPEMSFAGQQDTYLNILGPEHLLRAVVDCWGSLWTARAIGYRARNGVSQDAVSLAVVVQGMVQSQVSGVLFTANPLSGLRSQTVIDATLGLGEALVSGMVEPDHYVVDTARETILEKKLGAKALSVRSIEGGGTAQVAETAGEVQALPDDQILALARLGKRVEDLYAFPQDIEWAWAGEGLHLLQSRPITSLFPTPEGVPAQPLKVFFSFAAVQGMLDPITPLGRDALALIFAMGASLFGIRVTAQTQTVLHTAGERLWANITSLMRNTVGRNAARVALGLVEPGIRQALLSIWDEPRLQPERKGLSPRAVLQMARFFIPLAANILLNIASPRARRKYIVEQGERLLRQMQSEIHAAAGDRRQKLTVQAGRLESLARRHLPGTFLLFVSGVASAMASFNLLNKLAGGLPENSGIHRRDLVLEITRGLPHNPTTEMDLALWQAVQAVRPDPAALAGLEAHPAPELARRHRSGRLAAHTRAIMDRFLERYGGRGLGEIDLGRARWREEPTHVFESMSGYLRIADGSQAPDAVFARGARAAQDAVERLATALRATPRGWLKAHQARFAARRVRELMGVRESPKFFAVRMMDLIRQDLLKTGEEFVQAGELNAADDLFYLTFGELREFGAGVPRDWRGLIDTRRASYQRELRRRQIPRLLLSDGRAFYEGLGVKEGLDGALSGDPVSPGVAEGQVRIVLDPREAHLEPGEILVCLGTDPSWTPLFLTAGGLVMEVGGMMTHGAVVAREYGIPAIVGVHEATTRLRTGQRIRIDGSSGVITLETEAQPAAEPA